MNVSERIAKLREKMNEHGFKGYIVSSSDPDMSEIPASRWMSRKWISGFTGSAGTAAITLDKGGVWTDGRYYIQAAAELEGSGLDLFKAREPGVPSYLDWLTSELKAGDKIGIDGWVFDTNSVRNMKKKCAEKKIELIADFDLIDSVWLDRPALPQQPITELNVCYAGKSRQQKFMDIREKMVKDKADIFFLSSLDDIAWLLNLRGNDVNYNPLFIAYVVLDQTNVFFFVDNTKLDEEIKQNLTNDGVILKNYDDIEEHLKTIDAKNSVIFNPVKTNYYLFNNIPESCRTIEKREYTTDMKTRKNSKEIENLRICCIQDNVAEVKWMYWLEEAIKEHAVSELDAAAKLAEFRSKIAEFRGLSSNSISAFGPNAAMMHYAPTVENQAMIKKEGFYLIDSGGQYNTGTTDLTRTMVLGELSAEQKEHFTRVLRGVINLSRAKFLKGTTGANLDMLSRQPLWEIGIDYKCGTGHGIGYFLNVHEGPQNFSQAMINVPFDIGMVTSVEPGVYLENRYGIRTENMVLCVDAGETESGKWLQFETLTWLPIDIKGIEPELLTNTERQWINNYHQKVYQKLSPWLDEAESAWLQKMTQEI